MLKWTAFAPDGKTFVGFGLTDANLERLQAGEPIIVDLGAEMVPGSSILVVLMWGHTEVDIRGELIQVFDNPGRIIARGRTDPNPSNPLDGA